MLAVRSLSSLSKETISFGRFSPAFGPYGPLHGQSKVLYNWWPLGLAESQARPSGELALGRITLFPINSQRLVLVEQIYRASGIK